jgi:hypothetical protein
VVLTVERYAASSERRIFWGTFLEESNEVEKDTDRSNASTFSS